MISAFPLFWDRVAVVMILLGIVLRIIWALIVHPPGHFVYSDMGFYVDRAQRVAEGGGLDRFDAFWPSGTHLLLAVPFKLFGSGEMGLWAGAVLWCVLSSLIPLLAWRVTRLFLNPPAAALTASFCAVWPLYITYSGFFTSETPSLAFLLGALWSGYRARRTTGSAAIALGLLGGLLGGAAVANRPQLLLNLAILALPVLPRFRRQGQALAGIILGTTLILAGIIAHNSVVAGKPTGLSENSGMNFWLGHCNVQAVRVNDASTNRTFRFGLPVPRQLGRGERYQFNDLLPWDQPFFYERGLDCVQKEGWGTYACLLAT